MRETQRRNAAEGSERAVRVALSSSRRVVEAARARSVRSGGGDIRGKRNGWRLRASRAREELHAPAAGRSPNPGSSRSTRRRRATGERAFRLGRARLEVPVMKRDEIGSPPFFIAQAERHAADRDSSSSSRARASAAKRIQRICTLRLNAYTRSIFVFPLAIPHASRAATFAAPHSARARVWRRVRVVRSTANVAVAQATAPRARTALSVSRESSVTRGQKNGAARHGLPAGDEPGPERARGRARVLRVASGGEGEGQAVLPRGAHARHATRDRPRTRPPRTRCRR